LAKFIRTSPYWNEAGGYLPLIEYALVKGNGRIWVLIITWISHCQCREEVGSYFSLDIVKEITFISRLKKEGIIGFSGARHDAVKSPEEDLTSLTKCRKGLN